MIDFRRKAQDSHITSLFPYKNVQRSGWLCIFK